MALIQSGRSWVRTPAHQGQGSGLLTLIHKSIISSRRPDSPDTLADPHLEELTITAKLGNTDLIITNVCITPSSSCTGEYNPSLDHLMMTTDTPHTGRHRINTEPVPTEILEKMRARDDIRSRDQTSPALPEMDDEITRTTNEHKRQKWRQFVETLDHKTDHTKLWRTIKAIDGRSTPKTEN